MSRHALLSFSLLLLVGSLAVAQPAPDTVKIGEFSVVSELPRLPVLNQGMTGTCWAFATTSFLETEVARITGKPVDLSEIFTVRHTIVEKAKRFVAGKTKGVFGEGGLSHDVIAMVKEHGVVPHEAFTGLPQGQRTHNHSELFRVVKSIADTMAKRRRASPYWTKAVSGVVDAYLGEAPTEIEVNGKKMTPTEYARDHLKIPCDDYVEVMSYSYAPFHQKALLTVDDNWMQYDGYLNLPLDAFMEGMIHALEKGFSVAVDIDVSEPTYKARQGIGRLTDAQEKPGAITQEVRDKMFATKKTTDDHLMHVVGVVKDEEGRRHYLTKDSWGARHGRFKGYRVLSENYIRAKVLAYMVHKDGLPAKR